MSVKWNPLPGDLSPRRNTQPQHAPHPRWLRALAILCFTVAVVAVIGTGQLRYVDWPTLEVFLFGLGAVYLALLTGSRPNSLVRRIIKALWYIVLRRAR